MLELVFVIEWGKELERVTSTLIQKWLCADAGSEGDSAVAIPHSAMPQVSIVIWNPTHWSSFEFNVKGTMTCIGRPWMILKQEVAGTCFSTLCTLL